MDELTLKLKNQLVKSLTEHQELNKPYLTVGDKTYSRKQLAEEIESETEFGIKQMRMLLSLSLDLISRNKIENKL